MNETPASGKPLGKKKKILFTLILMAITGLACFAILEIAFRVMVGKQEKMVKNIPYTQFSGYYTYDPDSTFSFTNEDGRSISVHADTKGLRNPPETLAGARVIVLGDSFISALNTPEDQTLAARLRARGVKAYNGGMDGFSTINALYLLKDHLRDAEPETVVLFFYLGNDFRDNYFGSFPAPGAAPVTAKPGPALSLCLKSVFCDTFLYNHVYLGLIKKQAQDPMASYCLSEIQALRTEYDPAMRQAVDKTDRAFSELAALGRTRGFRVVVVGLPSKAQVYRSLHEVAHADTEKRFASYARETIKRGLSFDRPDQVAGDLARKNGLPYVSLLNEFRRNGDKKLYYYLDMHWTAQGQAVAADYIMAHGLE